MIPILNAGLEPERHAAWLREYSRRSLTMREALAALVLETFEAEAQDVARTRLALRDARGRLPHRFCLVLYGSGADDYTLRRLTPGDAPALDPAQTADASAAARDGERNAQRLSELMPLLDVLCGAQVALLERDAGDGTPPGPMRFPTPDDIWFESFTWLAELAWAIVVIANTNANLVGELQHLDDVGLHRRTLLFAGAELIWWGERSTDESALRRWALGVESIAQAFDFAAGQRPLPRTPN